MYKEKEMSLRDKMSEEAECVEAIFLSYTLTKSSQKNISIFWGDRWFKYYCPRISFVCNDKKYKKV